MIEIEEYKVIEEKKKKGMLVVVSAPSGTGKTTLCHMLVKEIERAVYSISVTSRVPRSKEVDGKDYFFVSEDEFKKMVTENKLLEWAMVHDRYYGTLSELVNGNLKIGKHIILDIDVQGGLQIKKIYPDAVLIFVIPPSMEELERRITDRKQDSDTEIEKRLKNSYEEIKHSSDYDYLVINNELGEALKNIMSIITAEECRL